MSTDDTRGLPDPLAGYKIGQIGILVPDLERAAHSYAALWRVKPWVVYTYGPETVPEMTYRGEPATHAMRLALAGEAPQIELVQPLRGPSIYDEFVEARGFGLHHVGVIVEELAPSAASMSAAGYELIQSGAGYGLDGDGGYAYFDTEDDLGMLVEIIERPKRRREPEARWPAG